MFHTFEGFGTPARTNDRSGDGHPARRATAQACEQCRRRKIRCDGERPCEACRWYKKAELCHYSDPRPSRRWVSLVSVSPSGHTLRAQTCGEAVCHGG